MKKLYIYPQTISATCLPKSNVLLLGSGSGPEPAPERQAPSGTTVKLTKLYI